ncbi:hypothetical protein QUF88_11105 [Bacillus sp. DX1.1]|uniref:hypothetical protein n=1 Tax=unclassified Bacillus (in: firmicutes) TaxID=185979 RepID=UPI002570B86B|nr:MULTISPECIES: hypothetical protein [unclassified Bacillus (in: firmicutes)]MDM5154365.1 hypothetical protein [Bacillus sp. DX1.1]WJE83275.1 hypothetical protein QRE67_08610 [Bacillus sp. DX3.1]
MQSTPYEKRSTETLKENLKDVKDTYNEDDWYYVGEEISTKLNVILRNDGDKYLEDVSIRIKIPKEDGIIVVDCIHSKPLHGIERLHAAAISNATISTVMNYPSVQTEEHYFIVVFVFHDI